MSAPSRHPPASPPPPFDPRRFWEERLAAHPDLVGTGETGLSAAYNRACYDLRARVLRREVARLGLSLAGASVLDVGSGVGFFVDFFLRRGARVTGVELTEAGMRLLPQRFPEARFLHGDVADVTLEEGYDVVNAFDVLYHIVDDARWERAVRRLARALHPGGVLFLTDVLTPLRRPLAPHNVMRGRARYEALLADCGVRILRTPPTHYLLNRDLGPLAGLNRLPWLLAAADRLLLALGADAPEPAARLLVGRRTEAGS
jgi:SAM-dependent methyltransferase